MPEPAAGTGHDRSLDTYGTQLRPLIEEVSGTLSLNLYGPGGIRIAQESRSGPGSPGRHHLILDHLGSSRVERDAGNGVALHHEYGPYGNLSGGKLYGAADITSPYYADHPYDAHQRLYLTPGRSYAPASVGSCPWIPNVGGPAHTCTRATIPLDTWIRVGTHHGLSSPSRG